MWIPQPAQLLRLAKVIYPYWLTRRMPDVTSCLALRSMPAMPHGTLWPVRQPHVPCRSFGNHTLSDDVLIFVLFDVDGRMDVQYGLELTKSFFIIS